jgi:hypothetical protein
MPAPPTPASSTVVAIDAVIEQRVSQPFIIGGWAVDFDRPTAPASTCCTSTHI